MKNLMPVGVLLAALTFLSAGCSSKSSDTAAVTEKPTDLSAAPGDSTGTALHAGGGDHGSTGHIYSCPMHPEVRSDKPGTCPKCGMTLEHTDKPAGGDGKCSSRPSPRNPWPASP